jgi:hypothetical protein
MFILCVAKTFKSHTIISPVVKTPSELSLLSFTKKLKYKTVEMS